MSMSAGEGGGAALFSSRYQSNLVWKAWDAHQGLMSGPVFGRVDALHFVIQRDAMVQLYAFSSCGSRRVAAAACVFVYVMQDDVAEVLQTVKEACDLEDLPYRWAELRQALSLL